LSEETIIIGRLPPPFGGVSVYCSRRYRYLKDTGNIVSFIDFGDKFFLLKFISKYKGYFEVNTLNFLVVVLFFISGRIKRTEFVDHNASRHYSGFKKKLLLYMLKGCRGVNVVNEHLLSFYSSDIKLNVVTPFIPPPLNDERRLIEGYPDNLIDFISTGNVVINSAWKLVPYESSDLYGIKTSISLLEQFNNIKLLIVIGSYDEATFDQNELALIRKYTEGNRLFLLIGQYEIWPLLRFKPICLRLTPTDGDSVTVREALYFGAPVLASDSIKRPEGCCLYEYGNMDSLVLTLGKLL
jgi:hypothetical protein